MSPKRNTNNAIVAVTICFRICGKKNHTTANAARVAMTTMVIQENFEVFAISILHYVEPAMYTPFKKPVVKVSVMPEL